MRIAHLSDPHLLSWTGARLRDFVGKRWIGGLNLLSNRAREHKPSVFEALVADVNDLAVDHVLCTGDITNVALPGEFAFARKHFDRFDRGTDDTTVLPGNHDAYVAAGLELFEDYFSDYCDADPEWQWKDGPRWPIVRVRGPIALIGLTTSHPTPWFNAWGEAGPAQLERTRAVLADERLAGLLRLVAIHHPPAGHYASHPRHGLRDYDAFAAVLAEAGAELVVHGHEHRDLRFELPGPDGSCIPVHGIQSATYAGPRLSHRARYRIYEIDGDAAAGRPQVSRHALRVYNPVHGAFEEDDAGVTEF